MRTLMLAALLLSAPPLHARHSGCDLDVLVGGEPRVEYVHDGTTYIEAVRGREYVLRLENPTPYRVGVALSVDGLNTIDAKHTDGLSASKWVLDPYETVEISGWQVSDSAARRFFFTGERNSYGAQLGETANLGVIEAVFYRERPHHVPMDFSSSRLEGGMGAPAAPAAESSAASTQAETKGLSDDYAATGMGDRTRHDVRRVRLDLDPNPVASVRLRYEFRPQLVKLGVLPSGRDPLRRREEAKGFEGYCPEPR